MGAALGPQVADRRAKGSLFLPVQAQALKEAHPDYCCLGLPLPLSIPGFSLLPCSLSPGPRGPSMVWAGEAGRRGGGWHLRAHTSEGQDGHSGCDFGQGPLASWLCSGSLSIKWGGISQLLEELCEPQYTKNRAWHRMSAQRTGPVIIFIITIKSGGRRQQLQAGKGVFAN